MAREGTSREQQLLQVARLIADNNALSHDWADFMEAARALERAGLLRDPLAHIAADGAGPVHCVAYEEKARDV